MPHETNQLKQAKRFQPAQTRRDFLGLTAAWSAVGAFVMAILGAMRLPMPSVFPESNSRVKLGRPKQFAQGSTTYFPNHRLWLFRDDKGFHAISSVCTHLGCIAEKKEDGQFHCPCHGSRFDAAGNVKGGPAPKGLIWANLSVSPEGWLVADTLKAVPQGTILIA
jgi:cytochrome b6-f complex iron-sulfur subunit